MSQSGLDRVRRVLRQRGAAAVVEGAADEVRARVEQSRLRRRPPRSFVVDGVRHVQLVHLYNRTWRNERAVEIPLAKAFLDRHQGAALELGNVLANYGRCGHMVVDKYERQPGVLNVDIVDYRPPEQFDCIVSVSTLEHVGWDEEPQDAGKIPRAVEHLRTLLVPSGRLFVTCPLAYNPHLDRLIRDDALGGDSQAFLLRDGEQWAQTDRDAAFAQAKNDRYGNTAIWVAEFPP